MSLNRAEILRLSNGSLRLDMEELVPRFACAQLWSTQSGLAIQRNGCLNVLGKSYERDVIN